MYMAVPRLAEPEPFFLPRPRPPADAPRKAASIKGASGRPAGSLDELDAVDLVVGGCVAVGEDGARLGKGGGFADLEYALASAAGLIGAGHSRGHDGARAPGAPGRAHPGDRP